MMVLFLVGVWDGQAGGRWCWDGRFMEELARCPKEMRILLRTVRHGEGEGCSLSSRLGMPNGQRSDTDAWYGFEVPPSICGPGRAFVTPRFHSVFITVYKW